MKSLARFALALFPGLLGVCACMPVQESSWPGDVAKELREHSGTALADRTDTEATIPQGVNLEDGLNESEAIALAIANNAQFHASLAAVGVSKADLLRARLMPNLSLSSVLGSSWEATLAAPLDFIWKRPARIRSAQPAYEAHVQETVQLGLDLMLEVRLAYIERSLAERRLQLASGAAERADHVSRITRSAAEAGNASGLESRVTQSQAAMAGEETALAKRTLATVDHQLRRVTGLDQIGWTGALSDRIEAPRLKLDADSAVEAALQNRPDVKAAALRLESAGARIGLARAEALNLAAGVKFTGDGGNRDARPSLDITLPLFNRGQADVVTARAQIEQAAFAYVARRDQVVQEVRDAVVNLDQSTASARVLKEEIVPALEKTVEQSERSYRDGDVSYLVVLDNLQRLIDAQRLEIEASATAARGAALLVRHTGGMIP